MLRQYCYLLLLLGRSDGADLGEVKFVSVLFRHGDRTPTSFYPNDPYKNSPLWKIGLGQLTDAGKRRVYELGLFLRKRYDALLTDTYSPSLLYAQSTDVDRTLMSAECVLAGMYPPKGAQVWNTDIQWQPIPVHTTPSELDNEFIGNAPCPAYDEESKRLMKSKDIEDLNKKFAKTYEILNKNTGEKKADLVDLFKMYNVLNVETTFNLTLPEWTKAVFPQPLTEAASYSFTLLSRTKKLARFKAGLMIQRMIDDMVASKSSDRRRFHLYSAHELTVATLLNALDVFDHHNPPYGACVILELRLTAANGYVVTIFYRTSSEEPKMLKMPGCASACPLDQFISITKPIAITPTQWDKECQEV